MKLVKVECPNCHASVDFDLDNLKTTCPYCDSNLIVDFDADRYLENKEETIRENNRLKESTIQKEQAYKYLERTKKADIRRQKQAAKQRKAELKYEDRKNRRASISPDDRSFLIIFLSMMLMAAVCFGVGLLSDFSQNLAHHEQEDIQLPVSSEQIKEEKYTYQEVQEIFETAGFNNIVLEKDEDVKIGVLKKEGLVKKVTVNGEKKFDKGSWRAKDARIVITYHAKKEKKSKKKN